MKRGKKKGQISLFIIVAIILLVVVVSYILVKNKASNLGGDVSVEIKPIYDFVNNCIKETAIDGIYYVSETGGYFLSPELSTEDGIAYYYFNGESKLPSNEKIESEISLYIENFLEFCIGDFVDYPDFEINSKELKVLTFIENNQIIVSSDYLITVKKADKTYTFNKFKSNIPIRMGLVYEVSNKIVEDQIENNGDVCISCIDDYAEENNVFVNILDYDDETILFIIRDLNSDIGDQEFKFYFASK
ncbi:MAG: hypothetical protein ABIH37_02395 [archaeon]